MKSDIVLFQHILFAIQRIENYTEGITKEKFLQNFMVQDAVMRNIEIIGEATTKIKKETRDKYPEIPWREIIAMRNMVIHEYFRTDPETVWQVLQVDLQPLKVQVTRIIESAN